VTAHAVAIIKICQHCSLGFVAGKKSQRWCSNACKVAAWQRRHEDNHQSIKP
jgi:hypothetical protein